MKLHLLFPPIIFHNQADQVKESLRKHNPSSTKLKLKQQITIKHQRHSKNKENFSKGIGAGSTVFERRQALVGNLELKRGQKWGWIIQDGDVGNVNSTHYLESQEIALLAYGFS